MSTSTPIDGGGKGYVRLYRKMLDNPLFTEKPATWLKIWIFILLRANWRESIFRPRQGEPVTVPAGSMVTSLEKIATHAAVSKRHARGCLEFLKKTHVVTIETTHHWTMITVLNWALYQQSDDDGRHTERHTERQAAFENTAHAATHGTTHAATLSKESKNLDKKYMSNSDELDSNPPTSQTNFQKILGSCRTKSARQIDPEVLAWFNAEFWPLYPRHEGKKPALIAANAAATTPEKRAAYLAGLRAQLPEYLRRKRERGQSVIPLASTWFNQDRVADEFAPAPEQQVGSRRPVQQDDYPEYTPLSATASRN